MRVKQEVMENKEDILVNAFMTCSNITEISKNTGIGRTAIYNYMQKDSFKEKLREERQRVIDGTVSFLQGNLNTCAETLMEIVRDKEASPQVRINACNAVFQNLKGLTNDNDRLFAEMAVKIYDSI